MSRKTFRALRRKEAGLTGGIAAAHDDHRVGAAIGDDDGLVVAIECF